MNRLKLGISLIMVAVSGCSSQPPRAIPSEAQAMVHEGSPDQQASDLLALPVAEAEQADQSQDHRVASLAMSAVEKRPVGHTPRQEYEVLKNLPEAESRALKFYLASQRFEYIEDGEKVVSGPIASGKASSPTPTGKFSVLSKDKDKESSKYTNEVGTQAWMPYSMQFHGNYFVHEGWLPGHPASHGCIRLGHYHARLLFERMKIGDPVTVTN